MTAGRENDLDPDQRRIIEAIRTLPMVHADAGFRWKLKSQFVDGTIRAPSPPDRETSWFPRPVVISISLSAAAVIFLLFLSLANRGPSWELEQPAPNARLLIDGEPVDLSRITELRAALHGGARLQVEGSSAIILTCAGHLVFQLPPETEITLPSAPKRWLGRHLRAVITRGRLRIVTGEKFAGASLVIHTPDAEVEVTGTTLAVILEPHGTCVCVMEGTVRAGAGSEAADLIPAGRRKTFYNDGRAPLLDSIRPDERMELEQLKTL